MKIRRLPIHFPLPERKRSVDDHAAIYESLVARDGDVVKAGDVVEIEIEKLGVLKNHVIGV